MTLQTSGGAAVDLGIQGLSDPVLIGQGGFGAVYRAEQPALGRTVAVKILSAPGMGERTRDRFERECIAIGALSGHPNIVTVFDSGINSWGRPYIVMDFMSRGSIADRVALDGQLQWPEAVDMGVKICGAVASAHAAGILHRDIKPQNVLVSAYGEPKLGDFGISSIGGEQTSSGTVTASLEHAAPELLDGNPASVATDVYALASTVYMMVSGQGPFARRPDEPIQSLINRILMENSPDLRPRGVPGALCDVLERGLTKDPATRYASATDLANALRDVQEQQGLVATTIVQTEAVGGFELLERFAPGGTGTTGPTRARVRNEYVPPTPPPTPIPVWKRPAFIAAAVLAFLAVGAGAYALTNGGRDDEPKETAVADTADEPIAKEPAKKERPGNNNEKDDKRQPKKGGGNVPGYSGGYSGSGSSAPAVPPSSGSDTSAPSSGSNAAPEGNDQNAPAGGDKTEPQKEEKPAGPPAPSTALYHLVKNEDHIMTTSTSLRNAKAAEGYRSVEVGYVYTSAVEGSRAITLDSGAVYVFASSSGTTEPQTSRLPLYRMTKNGEFFYTTSSSERNTYATQGWTGGGTVYAWIRPCDSYC